MKKNNVFLEKISESELKTISGGTWSCPPMPSYIKKAPNSSVYYAWVYANCTSVSSCSPSTWNICV